MGSHVLIPLFRLCVVLRTLRDGGFHWLLACLRPEETKDFSSPTTGIQWEATRAHGGLRRVDKDMVMVTAN